LREVFCGIWRRSFSVSL